MAANNVSNIHVSADVLSTLLSLQQGNLVDLQQQNLRLKKYSPANNTTGALTQYGTTTTARGRNVAISRRIWRRYREGILCDFYLPLVTFFWVVQNWLFTICMNFLIFHYKLLSMVAYRSFYFSVIEFAELWKRCPQSLQTRKTCLIDQIKGWKMKLFYSLLYSF